MTQTNPHDWAQEVEAIWQQQRSSWEAGKLLPAESYFEEHPELHQHQQYAVDVIFNEFAIRMLEGNATDLEAEFIDRFPQLESQLRRQFSVYQAVVELESQTAQETVPESESTSINLEDSAADPLESRFEIRGELGRGATSVVYDAWDRELEQIVAIKRPHHGLQNSERVRTRLIHEAQALARLHHPSIVPIREVGFSAGQLYLVSPQIQGDNLQAILQNQSPTVEQSVAWVLQIAEALDYAHCLGVIHRDVKPANIIVDRAGRALLTDFGLATRTGQRVMITQTGEIVGTPAYMAPEQVTAEQSCDCQCDVFSLGSTLFHLLTGRLPFEGSFAAVVHQLTAGEVPKIRDHNVELPVDLEAVVAKAMNRATSGRYSSARQFADDLRRFLAGETVNARPTNIWEKGLSWARKHPGWVVALVIFLPLIGFLAGTLWELDDVYKQRDRAVAAEHLNAKLLAQSACDAGRLAMQQGEYQSAIQHFQTALSYQDQEQTAINSRISVAPETTTVRFLLIDCHLVVGQLDEAAGLCQEILTQANLTVADQANLAYWQSELTARGWDGKTLVQIPDKRDWVQQLPTAKQEFLAGMNTDNSLSALRHFRAATAADPTHYGARRMALIMAFSLARFPEVQTECNLAMRLYPKDTDFQLLAALNDSALGDFAAAKHRISQLDLEEALQQQWIDFCQFLQFVAQPSKDTVATDLPTTREYLRRYLQEHHHLLIQRGWRFPRIIGNHILELTQANQSLADDQAVKQVCRLLAKVHPEGTLLSVAADTELIGNQNINPEDELERSLKNFLHALEAPAFFHGHHQNCWMGVYGNAVALALIHKKDITENQRHYVQAAENLDCHSTRVRRQYRVFAISLIRANAWPLAEKYIAAWNQKSEPGKDTIDARWYLGLVHQHNQSWIEQFDLATEVLKTHRSDMTEKDRNAWTGLRNQALTQLKLKLPSDSQTETEADINVDAEIESNQSAANDESDKD